MRKLDIKPGVVYAYRQPVSGEIVPVVFLSAYSWINTLRQDAHYSAGRAFKRPTPGTTKPRAGTVHNDGTIGYPAVIFPDLRPDSPRDIGKLITLRDFDNATTAQGDGFEFILVTSMARVTGEWEG